MGNVEGVGRGFSVGDGFRGISRKRRGVEHDNAVDFEKERARKDREQRREEESGNEPEAREGNSADLNVIA